MTVVASSNRVVMAMADIIGLLLVSGVLVMTQARRDVAGS